MHRRQVLLNMLLASAALTLPLGAYATQIRNARLWRTNDKLRLVLDLSGPVQYKTFTLTAPDRLIIDVSGSRLTGDFSQLALDRTVIKSIRSGHYGQGDDTRIVLDLTAPVQLNSFLLGPEGGQGHRLVLDMSSTVHAPVQMAELRRRCLCQSRPARRTPDATSWWWSMPVMAARILALLVRGVNAKKMWCCPSLSCWPDV
ncbi:hypothetical protein IBA8401_13520 [Pseudomonas syringae]